MARKAILGDHENKLGPEQNMSSQSQSLFTEEMHSEWGWEHGVNRKKLVSFTYELQS